jgi:hypothetical protein
MSEKGMVRVGVGMRTDVLRDETAVLLFKRLWYYESSGI